MGSSDGFSTVEMRDCATMSEFYLFISRDMEHEHEYDTMSTCSSDLYFLQPRTL